MATPLYDALVVKVRDWANREGSERALPDSIIQDALRYAADVAYRQLRVPPLEAVATYTITEAMEGTNSLTIPDDLTEFISLARTAPTSQQGVQTNTNNDIVYNAKADYRTFNDDDSQQYNFYRWTRRQNQILVNPTLGEDEVYELFYYRRLPALNARYVVNAANGNANRLSAPAAGETGTDILLGSNGTYYAANAVLPMGVTTTTVQRVGNEAPNWLRDEQEKILIWGALAHCFDYLDEDNNMQKYQERFVGEITLLNQEEGRRKVSGGNTQQNFAGYLI